MKRIVYFLLSIIILSSCSSKPSGPQSLTVMTHDSFAATDTVIHAFEQANNAKVTFIKSGDAGATLNKAILSKDSPLADVLYGVDNTLLSRALAAGIYQPYTSPSLKNIPSEYQLDATDNTLPVDFGYVCVVYDRAYFSTHNLAAPQTLEDLAKPEYKGLLVTENPATSSTGLDFLLATVKHFGDPSYLDYWKKLRDNGLVVVDGWETAYYTNFSGQSGNGTQSLVVSYGTDPAYEVMNSISPLSDSPVAAVIGPDTCFRQIEFVGILKGTKQPGLAEKFVDFMLSGQFQADMPGQMAVYPVLSGVALPDAFTKFAQIPSQPAILAFDEIAKNRDAWIQAWSDAVLK
jgi:thiamine transport system substrate-binding protein